MLLASCARGPAATVPTPPPTPPPEGVLVHIGDGTLAAEVAATPAERYLGLMHRTSLRDDDGMLFLFPQRRQGGFWMKNTLIPLSIAFVADVGGGVARVVDVLDMEPCTADLCPTYRPTAPYDMTLEVNQGWFARHGVRRGEVGFRIEGDLPAPS